MEDNSIQRIEENNETFNNNSSFEQDYFENNNDNNGEHIPQGLYNYSRKSSFSILSSNSSNISSFTLSVDSKYSRRNTVILKRNKKEIKFIFCVKCKNFYNINFENNIMNFECGCQTINNCPIDHFIRNYTTTNKEEVGTISLLPLFYSVIRFF